MRRNMERREQQPLPQVNPSGGPPQAHQPLAVSGPFRGADYDSSDWFGYTNGQLARADNIDLRLGLMYQRPGWDEIKSQAAMKLLIVTGGLSSYDIDSNDYRRFVAYRDYGFGIIKPTSGLVGNDNGDAGYTWPFDGRTQFATYSGTVGIASVRAGVGDDVTFGGTYDYNGAGFNRTAGSTLTQRRYLVRCYVQPTAGNDTDDPYRIVTAHAGANATVTPAFKTNRGPGSIGADYVLPLTTSDYTTAPALGTNDPYVYPTDYRTAWCYVPSIQRFLVCGPHGGVLWENVNPVDALTGATDQGVFWQEDARTNATQYRFTSAIYYGNRVLATYDEYAVYNSAGGTWQNFVADGFVYSGNGDVRDFASTSSGTFAGELGAGYRLFALRGTAYALCSGGIISIQKTGNSLMPFRQQALVETFGLMDVEPVIVEGQYALIATRYGPARFDGSTLQPATPGVAELWRGDPAVRGCYDFSRRRAFFVRESGNANCMDTDSGTWVNLFTGATAATADIYDILPINYTSGGELLQEYAVLGSNGIMTARNDTRCDDQSTVMAFKTPVIGGQDSRTWKSCDRVRLVYELHGTTLTNPPTGVLRVYVDGGITKAHASDFTVTLTAPTASGQVQHVDVSFAPIHGRQFSFEFEFTSGVTTNLRIAVCDVQAYLKVQDEHRLS